MGTPDFAVPCLDMLVNNGYEVAAVVTQPDKPAGRKQSVLKPPPVKEAALKYGIRTVLQPEKVRTREFLETIKNLAPDLVITAAYGKIIPKDILEIPPYGCINVHGSLLPKYRGAAPIQWAIINGDSVTGVTTMFMDAGMDTGDILLKREVPIPENMTCGELYKKLENLGAEVLLETLKRLENGTLQRIPQKHEDAVAVSMMKKEMGLIDWTKSAWEVHNLVRGTDPWPGAFTFYKGERLKIWKTSPVRQDEPVVGDMPEGGCTKESGDMAENGGTIDKTIQPCPGRIRKIMKERMVVETGKGLLNITEIQFEACRKMSVLECGHNMDEGEILG